MQHRPHTTGNREFRSRVLQSERWPIHSDAAYAAQMQVAPYMLSFMKLIMVLFQVRPQHDEKNASR